MTWLSAVPNRRAAPVAVVTWLALVAVTAGHSLAARATLPVPAIAVYDSTAQADNGSDEAEVAPGDIEKYVAVYKAMQRDRTLTVDQAATQHGLTVQSFRDLEGRIERDDAALQRARDELEASALEVAPTARPTSATPKK